MMISDEERRKVAKLLRERAGYEMGCVFKELYGDCNSAGLTCGECNERAMRYLADLVEPSEPEVKYVAEVKIDGWRLEELVHDAAVELTGIDRDALLELADGLENDADNIISAARNAQFTGSGPRMEEAKHDAYEWRQIAHRIRKALGVTDV